jgi:site-specific DNA-methyltransferase (adenine-specific)
VKTQKIRNQTITLTESEKAQYLALCKNNNSDFANITDTIIHGDFFDVIENLPDAFVDLLIADPPYNLAKTYGSKNFGKMSDDDYRNFTEQWVSAVKRVLKSNASIYVCCDWQSSLIIGAVLKEHFYVKNRITWQREKGRGSSKNWKNSMEDIWFATVSNKSYTFNAENVKMRRRVIAPYRVDGKPKGWTETKDGQFRDTYPSNFWDDVSVPFWSMRENTEHPTQKSEKLIAKLILASSNAGDMVFDPFAGSGTTAVTAKKLDRRFTAIEREGEYCAVAQKRLAAAEGDKSIQGLRDGVFWERNTANSQNKCI